ncbi:MAG: hypothetical protein ACRDTG_11080 [Pseudonocardiaceae bacterium]
MKPAYLDHRRGGGLRRLFWLVLCLLLIVYVLRHPSEAATTARDLFEGLNSVVESVITFLQQAIGGEQP